MQKYPRGRRGSPAKGVGCGKRREGSNPSFCAKKETLRNQSLFHFATKLGSEGIRAVRTDERGARRAKSLLLRPGRDFEKSESLSFCNKTGKRRDLNPFCRADWKKERIDRREKICYNYRIKKMGDNACKSGKGHEKQRIERPDGH